MTQSIVFQYGGIRVEELLEVTCINGEWRATNVPKKFGELPLTVTGVDSTSVVFAWLKKRLDLQ